MTTEDHEAMSHLTPGKEGTSIPLRWDIEPTDSSIATLLEAERAVPTEVVKDLSLRAKIIDACGLTCTFCHNEGTPVAIDNPEGIITIRAVAGRSGRVSVFSDINEVDFLPGVMDPSKPEFKDSIVAIRDQIGLKELHLTGGEPTLHPQLSEVVRVARSAGYSVSMTSNGERGASKIKEYAQEGLAKINYSIFGTTPQELAMVQNDRYQDVSLASKKIEALHESIAEAADAGIKVGANIVMSNSAHNERVRRLLEEFDSRLDVRILPDLSNTHGSARAIYNLLFELGAVPVLNTVEAGSSNARVRYVLRNGRLISFKQIRPTRLEECDNCQFNNPTDCKEGFYGTRLYIDRQGGYRVGVCMQRMDLTIPINEFLSGDLSRQVVELRETEYNEINAQYTKEQIADADN